MEKKYSKRKVSWKKNTQKDEEKGENS